MIKDSTLRHVQEHIQILSLNRLILQHLSDTMFKSNTKLFLSPDYYYETGAQSPFKHFAMHMPKRLL